MANSRFAAFLLLLVACGGPPPPAERAPGLSDVIVVTMDTTRADKLGVYGYFRDTTPALDAFAEEAVVFERCLAPVGQTLPSHASLLTGLYPYEHGLLANRSDEWMFLRAPGATSVATAMSQLGYETAAFVSAEPVKRSSGLAEGFEVWWQPEEKTAPSERVVAEALKWLNEEHERPIFLWLHVFDPHAPYAPPAPYDTMFASNAAQESYFTERKVVAMDYHGYTAPNAHNLYDGEVRYMDDQLAKFFDALRTREEWDDTVAVVTADHGEELFQHTLNGHNTSWYIGTHVPLILKAPGLAPGRVDAPVTMADVMPTAIGRVPALREGLSAWLSQLSGRDALAVGIEPRPVVGHQAHVGGKRKISHSILDGRWRLIVDLGPDKLFDLNVDPHELSNVATEHPDVVTRLRAELRDIIERQHERGRHFGAGAKKRLDQERIEALEALGYGGGDEDEDDENDER